MLSNALFQSKLWDKFQASLPGRESGQIGKIHWTILPSSYHQSYLYLNRVTHPQDLIKSWQEIITLAQKKGCFYIKLEPNWPKEEEFNYQHYRLFPSPLHIQPSTTLYLDVSKSPDHILQQMKPKGRYNIKVASKHGITYRSFQAKEKELDRALEIFYQLLKTTSSRDNFGIHPQSYYKKFLQELAPHSKLYLAYYHDTVVAGLIAIFYEQEAIYYYGASDSEKRNTMATYGLQWQVIQDAQKLGMKVYDFLGIADPNSGPEHPWFGVTEFKQKFGGTVYEYAGTYHYVLSPFKHFIFCTLKQAYYEFKRKYSSKR